MYSLEVCLVKPGSLWVVAWCGAVQYTTGLDRAASSLTSAAMAIYDVICSSVSVIFICPSNHFTPVPQTISHLSFSLFSSLLQISIPLSTAFGADTEGAQWIVGYLLEKVINNLSVWSSEPELANDTVELLVCLVEKRERFDTDLCIPT